MPPQSRSSYVSQWKLEFITEGLLATGVIYARCSSPTESSADFSPHIFSREGIVFYAGKNSSYETEPVNSWIADKFYISTHGGG